MTSLEEYVRCLSSLLAGKPALTKIPADLEGSCESISACSYRQLLAETRHSVAGPCVYLVASCGQILQSLLAGLFIHHRLL
jgi:hypothetical protein